MSALLGMPWCCYRRLCVMLNLWHGLVLNARHEMLLNSLHGLVLDVRTT